MASIAALMPCRLGRRTRWGVFRVASKEAANAGAGAPKANWALKASTAIIKQSPTAVGTRRRTDADSTVTMMHQIRWSGGRKEKITRE